MKPGSPYKRTDRLAELIKQELASILLTEVRDPGVKNIVLTSVKVTKDLSIAKVYYLLMGLDDADDKTRQRAQKRAASALDRASGFLRRTVGQRIQMRITPRLDFYWDQSVEYGRKMDRLFDELASERQEPDAAEQGESDEP